MRYQRVTLKLSGAAVSGDEEFGFDHEALEHIADEVIGLHASGVQVSVVIGGGNIFRGNLGSQWGIERAEADNIGMMGTIVNSLMLRGVITGRSEGAVEVRVMTAIPVNSVAEPYIRLRAAHHMEKGYVVIFAGGTGQPYVTTDYTAAQRALETRSEALLYAKNQARGIFTADPQTDPQARLYRRMNYNTILRQNLKVVDLPSVILARDNELPIHVFDFDEKGTIRRICEGEDIGTLVCDKDGDILEGDE
ncbi:MAG: UMP kinase [Gemmatimonadetes bacterium]|jgi:uridylate kinase|nr:UMP kinase [Gemmatimonadota bacterium]MBT7858667.1 UMP kinase [Gemmatimonadota bacterium]